MMEDKINDKECYICYELLENKMYCLIEHATDKSVVKSKIRGHYFHYDCIKKEGIKKCPFDRELIKKLKIINDTKTQIEEIKLINYNDYSLLDLNKIKILDIKENINRQDLYGRTIFYYACNLSKYNFIKNIIKYNPDITISNNDRFTPLMSICSNGNMKLLNLLLKHPLIEYTIYNVDNYNKSALEYAIKYNNKDIMYNLLKYFKNNGKEAYLTIINNKIKLENG